MQWPPSEAETGWYSTLVVVITKTQLNELRQRDRVRFRIPIEVSWAAVGDVVRNCSAHTLLVSRNGGVLKLAEKLTAGQGITLRRRQNGNAWKSTRAQVLDEMGLEPDGFLYAFKIVEAHRNFWDIEFPRPNREQEAIARLLMECSFCHRREVAYLDSLDLKSFEARNGVARICDQCERPSIWIECVSISEATSPEEVNRTEIEPRKDRRRKRPRVTARLLACVRRRGFGEEVAICEDLSKGGLSFRSRNRYPEATLVDVAVPFTPGAGAIFVPARIAFSMALPKAGLFKHGASYLEHPSQQEAEPQDS
jgi:hypothetical protein